MPLMFSERQLVTCLIYAQWDVGRWHADLGWAHVWASVIGYDNTVRTSFGNIKNIPFA